MMWPLAEIASPAGQRQITWIVGTSVLACTYVLDVKRGPRQGILGNAAVFALMLSSFPYESAYRFVHDYPPLRCSTVRAFACMMPMKSMART
jgi:hypothetical protein